MKKLIGLVCFLLAFSLGYFAVMPLINQIPPISSVEIPETEMIVSAQLDTEYDFVPEIENVHIEGEYSMRPFQSLEMPSQVDRCKSASELNGLWTGLFKRGNSYSLEHRKITVGKRKILQEDEDPLEDNFLPIEFKGSKNALFLLTKTDRLKAGSVKTLFLKPTDDPSGDDWPMPGSMKIGHRQQFNIGKREWIIRSTTGTMKEGNKVVVLVVESKNKKQIVWYRTYFNGIVEDAGWLDWVGDLDGDERLDFQMSFFEQNGGHLESILYLSSIAKKNEFVRPYAFYSARAGRCE